jgi:hypothetical protein
MAGFALVVFGGLVIVIVADVFEGYIGAVAVFKPANVIDVVKLVHSEGIGVSALLFVGGMVYVEIGTKQSRLSEYE